MPTVVATVGGSTSNSYVEVAEADTFFDERLQVTAWTGASADDKARAVIQATRRIDQEQFVGHPVRPLTDRSASGTTQALQWPRYNAQAPDGWWYDQDVIPERVKRATMLLAHAILAGDFDADDTGLEGFEEIVVDVLRVKPVKGRKSATMPDEVRRELQPLLTTMSSSNFRLVRG